MNKILHFFTFQPMRVHISEATKKCLENTEFQTEFRGLVELKVTKITFIKQKLGSLWRNKY